MKTATYINMSNSDVIFLMEVALDHQNWSYYASLQQEADRRGI